MAIKNGTPNNDTLKGTEQADVITGFAGNDTIFGKGGNDYLFGNQGDDKLFGGKGNDFLYGNEGNDKLFGEKGDDFLQGYGGVGISEYDELTGGAGKDTFSMVDQFGNPAYLNDDYLDGSSPTGFANITDFKLGEDKIQLDGFHTHYRLISVFWGQEFGNADTDQTFDAALVYIGAEQDKQDVVAVLQDVSAQFVQNNHSTLLNDPTYFTFI